SRTIFSTPSRSMLIHGRGFVVNPTSPGRYTILGFDSSGTLVLMSVGGSWFTKRRRPSEAVVEEICPAASSGSKASVINAMQAGKVSVFIGDVGWPVLGPALA